MALRLLISMNGRKAPAMSSSTRKYDLEKVSGEHRRDLPGLRRCHFTAAEKTAILVMAGGEIEAVGTQNCSSWLPLTRPPE